MTYEEEKKLYKRIRYLEDQVDRLQMAIRQAELGTELAELIRRIVKE